MFVSLFSGCASTSVATRIDRVPMDSWALNNFKRDCNQKPQQVAMLQSMRQTRDERVMAGLDVAFNPFMKYTDPARFQHLKDMQNGDINVRINNHLLLLEQNCP
jgi:hypothetical protein